MDYILNKIRDFFITKKDNLQLAHWATLEVKEAGDRLCECILEHMPHLKTTDGRSICVVKPIKKTQMCICT